jgi:hypothetical protein
MTEREKGRLTVDRTIKPAHKALLKVKTKLERYSHRIA